MPEMIFVPQRSISKSGLGGGACKDRKTRMGSTNK